MEAVAELLSVSTKTVRRRIDDGTLVAHRIGRMVRVDGTSVARLLTPWSDDSHAVLEARMVIDEEPERAAADQPRLLRQLPRSKVWVAWLNFREVPLGTTDKIEAERRLAKLVRDRGRELSRGKTRDSVPLEAKEQSRRRPYRVYREADRFCVKYYDQGGRRRKHWLPNNLPVPIVTMADAEAYAAAWYRDEFKKRPARSVSDSSPAGDDNELLNARITFEDFGRLWTSGELARRYPDHVKTKATANDDESRLKTYVYPHIGSEPVCAFEGRNGLDLVERVVIGLPPVGPTFRAASRRQILQAVHRVLSLAVYPARLISANPLPRGFLPKASGERAKSYLYPDEDARLMEYREAPLQERLLYGILAREGLRVSELLDLTWRDVDLTRGVLTLDENKTDEPRAWAMDPGVVMALRLWRERFVPRVPQSRPILADSRWRRIDRYGIAERLRMYLRAAGVTRPQLFESSENRIALRAHDLRATFVTISLALGKSEAWITDRTGHKSSQMIYRYKRAARTHTELALGALRPLHEAIPELR